MPTINFTKQSGVITVQTGANPPLSFFGYQGSFIANASDDGWNIDIGGTPFAVKLTDLRVNGQDPGTMAIGKILLTAIFGT